MPAITLKFLIKLLNINKLFKLLIMYQCVINSINYINKQ